MKRRIVLCLMTAFMFLPACGRDAQKTKSAQNAPGVDVTDESRDTQKEKRPLADVPPAQRANYYSEMPPMTIDPSKTYVATIHTKRGDLVLELDAFYAPIHTNNFIFLARQGFYDGLTFHRWEPDFVLQGGDPTGTGHGGPGYLLPAEIGLPHIKGAVGMARKSDAVNPERKSNGSQFYITYRPAPFLDGQYTVFGKLVAGFDVMQKMTRGDVMLRVDIEEREAQP